MKIPKTLGACIDLMYKLKQERAVIEKSSETIKAQENEIEVHLLDSFGKSDLEGARGKLAVAGVNISTVPTVKDWDKLYAYILKNKAWDLLQKRASATAFRERWDDEVVIPGVEAFTVIKLSLKKR